MAAASTARSKDQLREFLQFFDVKRDLFVSEACASVRDSTDGRLFDDVYSKDDVEDILGQVTSAVGDRVKRDLDTTIHMAALVLESVFVSAEEHGVTVALDMSRTEDEAALARVRELKSVLAVDADMRRKGAVKLDSLRDEHQRLIADVARLTEEAKASRDRAEAMAAQVSALTRARDDANAKVQSMTAEIAALRAGVGSASATSKAHEAEVAALSGRVSELSVELERTRTDLLTAQREREASVNNSKPFLQLKALLQRKNAQLADLRARIVKYEPDAADE